MKQDRKLYVVLFADIQGYTALMQSDEPQALRLLDKSQSVLKEEIGRQELRRWQYLFTAILSRCDRERYQCPKTVA